MSAWTGRTREELERRLSETEQALATARARVAELEARLAATAAPRGMPAPPVIHIRSLGNIANRMIQHMAALALQARVPHAVLAGVRLPEWGIDIPEAPIAEPAWRIPSHRVDLAQSARLLARGPMRSVVLMSYMQNVANLLPPDAYRRHYGKKGPPNVRFGDDELVISLRMNEVLSGFYPYYTLLPVAFYREVVDRSGLKPVFFGQLTPSAYLDALHDAFPDARFIEGSGPMPDFEVLRSAANLCLSISTFSWTAAYLGDARRIIMPVNGLFSPGTCGSLGDDIDLVPRLDPRVEPWLFPVNYAVPAEQVLVAHAALAGRWRRVEPAECAAIMAGHARAPRQIADYLALFDAEFYLRTHREIADAVASGALGAADHHYRLHGFDENRVCFALDAFHYARTYADAADAVGYGQYRDLHHFHAARGVALGYLAMPCGVERAA